MAAHEDNTLDAETLALFANAPERFVRKLKRDGECIVWVGAISTNGYGFAWDAPNWKVTGAHRLSYRYHFGDIPTGLYVMHSCDRRECVNPLHLSVGTCKDNMADCVAKGRQGRGSRNGRAKLSEDDVRKIRHRFGLGEKQADLCREYKMSPAAMCMIVNGIYWKHILGT